MKEQIRVDIANLVGPQRFMPVLLYVSFPTGPLGDKTNRVGSRVVTREIQAQDDQVTDERLQSLPPKHGLRSLYQKSI
jgi:hypothetical protein